MGLQPSFGYKHHSQDWECHDLWHLCAKLMSRDALDDPDLAKPGPRGSACSSLAWPMGICSLDSQAVLLPGQPHPGLTTAGPTMST